jgi:hypothetical protein
MSRPPLPPGTSSGSSQPLAEAAPRRVEILVGSGGSKPRPSDYFKRGQFAYVIGTDARGGANAVNRDWPDSETKEGETAYLVSKSPGMRGGALWFTKEALRFTRGGKPRAQ